MCSGDCDCLVQVFDKLVVELEARCAGALLSAVTVLATFKQRLAIRCRRVLQKCYPLVDALVNYGVSFCAQNNVSTLQSVENEAVRPAPPECGPRPRPRVETSRHQIRNAAKDIFQTSRQHSKGINANEDTNSRFSLSLSTTEVLGMCLPW